MKTRTKIERHKLNGDAVRQILKAKKLTRLAIADRMHYSDTTVNQWVKGTRKPSIDDIETLADILGCEVEDIITNVECDE